MTEATEEDINPFPGVCFFLPQSTPERHHPSSLLDHLLWKFRNGVLHGHSVEEMESKEREWLFQEIIAAYNAYHLDHFIIPDSSRHLFTSKTLKRD